ncbi:MAG TPA: hypothetical protein VM491_17865 [Burkholderiaceae bacterium]|jgi:hypothetical protein|nr:hypothetical protein [Burkholderiaceae bacterium]
MAVEVLDGEMVAFLGSGLSIALASRGADNAPHVARAIGCSVERGRAVVLLDSAHGRDVLADLRANGRIAAVFSQPSTHRTIQLKGADATVSPARDEHWQLLARYRAAFDAELSSVGFGGGFAQMLTRCEPGHLMAIAFTPDEAYVQTPGPQAGQPIQGTRA